MSQVIRKYADGGSTQNLDAAPLKILGQYYNPESFRKEALGSKAMSYAKAMGFNSDQTHQFISDLKDHVNRIINGTMTFTDEGTLENTDDSWENTGKYAKKKFLGKGLTEEQLKNNRSIDVTNYLIDSLRTGSFSRTKYNSPKSYTMEFDKLFQTKFHPNIDFDDYVKTWDSLDPGDKKTGKRGVTNRLKSIGDLLSGEADKLDNDATYRRQFSWEGWENNWKGRQSSYTQKLRDAAKKLSDGIYSDEDKRYLASIGINLDKYLSTSDEETTQKIEAARKEREAREEKEKEKVRKSHNNGFQSALPWQTKTPVLWWDGNSYTYGSDDYNTLYNNNSDVKQYIDTVYADNQNNKLSPDAYYEGYSLPATIGNTDYAVDISEYFPILKGTKSYVIRKDPLDPSTAAVYIPNQNHTRYLRYSIHKKEDGTYYAAPFAGQNVTEGINLGKLNPQAVAHPLTTTHYSSVFDGKDLSIANNLASYFKLRSVTAPMSEHFGDAKSLYDWLLAGKGTVKGTGNNRAIRMTTEKGRYVLLLDVPGYGFVKYYLKQNPGNKPLRYWNLDKVVKQTYKDGGVIKAQAGVRMAPIEPKSTQTIQPTKVDNTTKLYASLSGKENARNQFLAQDTLTGTDLVRLGSAITDLTSAVAGFVPGLNIASTATGMASSLTDFGADMTDLANDRKGVSFLDSLGTLGLNLGMDAVSLLPGLKSFKAASAIKRIASYVPHIAGAIQTYNLITDDNLKRSVGETLAKVSSLDVSRLNTQDFRNLAYLGRTILGVKGAYKQITSRKTKATGNVEVGGTVKVNGETKKITASIPKEQIKTFSKNDKVAREALVEAANKKFGKPKTESEEGLSFSDKDITLNTNTIGKVRTSTIREELNNNNIPKKVFEGWFGSKGLNWKFSDYKLSKNNSLVAKLYADIIGKQLFNGWNKMNPSTKKKLIQDNKKVFDDAIKEYKMQEYFAKMNHTSAPFAMGGVIAKYKIGGSFIPKFGDSGIIDYLNYDNPYIEDINDIYSVIGLDPNQQFEGFKGTSNTKTWNNNEPTLIYPNEWYDTNHKSVVDITTKNVFDELKKYHNLDNGSHIFGDVTNAYNTWHGTNTNGSVEDFINYYNNSVSQLRKWAKEKSTLPYNTLGQGDKNDLFNTLYKSYTVGFDKNQKDVLGPGTYRRIPNQFANLNEFKNNRIGKLGDKDVWIDNAGYLRIGEYGKVTPTSKKIEKTDPKRGTKTVGGVNVDPSGILGLTEVITGMTANTQATKKLMESTPTLKQAPWINRYIFGNYPALSRALQSAGELNTQASTPISSDAALAYAAQLEANAKGRELIDTGNQRNFETYWTSRNNVQQGNELNETNAINVVNENNAAANAMRNAKLKWQADLITSNVSGNIKPWLSEQRSYINQNNALKRKYKLDYALKLSTQQAAMNQEQLMKKYLDEAKENAKTNNIDITDKSDDAIISDYFERNPEVQEAYNSELRKIQRDAYKSQFDLYTNINRIPIGLGFTYQPKRTLVYNPNLEQYVESNKKGGSLTAKDRIKIQQEKDFNKKMLSDSKESIKSIRENNKEFHRTYRSMSSGTLALIKKAMQ